MNSTDRDIVEEIFRSVLELDAGVALDAIERERCPRWDSMAQVALVSALDDEFDLVIAIDDAVAMTSFARCLEVLERYLGRGA